MQFHVPPRSEYMHSHVEWIPHQFLLARFKSRLTNFLKSGSSVRLLDPGDEEVVQRLAERKNPALPPSPIRHRRPVTIEEPVVTTPVADPDAEVKIPQKWKSVDRLLDVYFLRPPPKATKRSKPANNRKSNARIIQSDEEGGGDDSNDREVDHRRASLEDGVEPEDSLMETWDTRKRRGPITIKDAEDVIWAYIKWQDLAHEEGKPLQASALHPFHLRLL